MLCFGQTGMNFARDISETNFTSFPTCVSGMVEKYNKFLAEPPKKARPFLLVSCRSSQAKFSSMQKC